MEKSAVGWRFHNLSGIHFVLCRSQRDQREERLKFFEKKWCACVCLYDRYMIARSAEIACASMGRQKGTNPSGLYLSQRGKFKRRGFATFADTTPDKFDTESRENAFFKYWNAKYKYAFLLELQLSSKQLFLCSSFVSLNFHLINRFFLLFFHHVRFFFWYCKLCFLWRAKTTDFKFKSFLQIYKILRILYETKENMIRQIAGQFRSVVLNLFEVREHFWLYEKFAEHQN